MKTFEEKWTAWLDDQLSGHGAQARSDGEPTRPIRVLVDPASGHAGLGVALRYGATLAGIAPDGPSLSGSCRKHTASEIIPGQTQAQAVCSKYALLIIDPVCKGRTKIRGIKTRIFHAAQN